MKVLDTAVPSLFSFTKETKRRVESQTRYYKGNKRDIIDDSLLVEEIENVEAIHEDNNKNDTKLQVLKLMNRIFYEAPINEYFCQTGSSAEDDWEESDDEECNCKEDEGHSKNGDDKTEDEGIKIRYLLVEWEQLKSLVKVCLICGPL